MATLCGTVEAYVDGDWADVTEYTDVEQAAQARHGRDTILTSATPDGALELWLRDNDRRFMPGNTAAYSDFDEGTPIRWSDVISATTVWYFTGTVRSIQTVIVTDEGDTEAVEQWAVVTCIDPKTRMESAQAFPSTLAAYIKSTDADDLATYWPLVDRANPFRPMVGQYPVLQKIVQGTVRPVETHAELQPAGGATMPGDDAPGAYFVIGMNGAASADWASLRIGVDGTSGGFVPPSGSFVQNAARVVFWMNLELPVDEVVTLATVRLRWAAGLAGATITLTRRATVSGGDFSLAVTGSIAGTLNTSLVAATDKPYTIALKVDPGNASSSMELWIDQHVFTTTATGYGSPITPGTVGTLSVELGGKFQGTMSHLQVRNGAYSSANFLAQREVGLLGLARQTVDERIASIWAFAGGDPALLTLDTSMTTMQKAALAGQKPGAAIAAAVETDQGLWFGDPEGMAVFQSRTQRYFDPDAAPAEIPYAWLASPLGMLREQRINSATVDQDDGGAVGYTDDASSIAQYGESAFSATLQTTCDADPQVLASFVLANYLDPKTRLAQLVFNIDSLEAADQLTLLSLSIGARLQITGAPADWPTSALHMSLEGRAFSVGMDGAHLVLTGSPVLGSAGGAGDTWFRLGTSELGGTDVMPF